MENATMRSINEEFSKNGKLPPLIASEEPAPARNDEILTRKAAVTPEPFVSAEEAAHFLSIKRRYLLTLARRGIAGAYALGTGTMRRVWVFRLSELAAAIANRNIPVQEPEKYGTIQSGNLHAGKRTA
jgi:hypothetical protein